MLWRTEDANHQTIDEQKYYYKTFCRFGYYYMGYKYDSTDFFSFGHTEPTYGEVMGYE